MSQAIKIFVYNNVICIEPSNNTSNTLNKQIVQQLLNKPENVILKHTLPEQCLASLTSELKLIEAAGGIVVNEQYAWLMIYRRGYWDLPKGKIDDNEHPYYTAQREILEECGIQVNNSPCTFVNTTYHVYYQHNEIILKRTYWYMFFLKYTPQVRIQTEEDIVKAEWVTKQQWNAYKPSTYSSIVHLMEQTNLI
ncbi:MAG: NUDIX domain-containing protein [Bacteroidales bacterium]|nr:NUDIX domain-containing protein [Bacteroidales bacterium]